MKLEFAIPISGTKVTNNERMNKLRSQRIALGICRDCGLFAPVEGKPNCVKCRSARKNTNKIHQKVRNEKGLCVRCGKKHSRAETLCKICSELQIERMRHCRKENKLKVVAYFGGMCKCCGESDIRTLSIDHIDNNGKIDCSSKSGKRIISPTWYARLVRAIDNGSIVQQNLQLLCFNCHAKKDLKPWWYEET